MPSKTSKASNTDLAIVGKWIFLVGLVIALLGGLVVARPSGDPKLQDYLNYLLMLLGLVGGYLFVKKEDEHHFTLLALGLALFVALFGQTINSIPRAGSYVISAFYFVAFFLGVAFVAVLIRNIIAWFSD